VLFCGAPDHRNNEFATVLFVADINFRPPLVLKVVVFCVFFSVLACVKQFSIGFSVDKNNFK